MNLSFTHSPRLFNQHANINYESEGQLIQSAIGIKSNKNAAKQKHQKNAEKKATAEKDKRHNAWKANKIVVACFLLIFFAINLHFTQIIIR
jgi:hypothetical protein